MGEGILVFASKEVGAALVVYLLEQDAAVSKIIVGNSDDLEIFTAARAHGIPAELYHNQTQTRLVNENIDYEWLLNLWSPHILSSDVLALAEHRLNTHPSLVPICQGNDNAAWAIRKSLPAGVSLLEMRKQIDAGEVYVQREVPSDFPIRGSELHALLQREIVELFKESWPAIRSRVTLPKAQQGPVSYHTRKQTEEDRVLDTSITMTLGEFLTWIFAHDFHPGTTAEVHHQGVDYKITLNIERK